ncbi:tyrosinase family protein [Nitrosomonas halophila]|uniref:Tyrosinase n=1 Tax=Nitrosomonas halophila TaxID=44576 RepID=A0A1H3PKM2_9PROT|nr:tyrosinase family protein [Nitrosomonas halophila]SDZ01590.1 tyrosinase [Nitrosomonas halophila]
MNAFHTILNEWAKSVAPVTLLLLSATVSAETPRISVLEFSQDAAKVTALEKGIASMNANSSANPDSAEYRTSFAYWANTHGYFGKGKNATDLQEYIAYRMPSCLETLDKETCNEYYAHMANTPVPNDGFTENVWGTCQHGNLNFLPWHRMYLHFFERTLRKQSGDADLSLPYWNYYDEKSKDGKGLAIPFLVRQSASDPLYDRWRTPGLNDNATSISVQTASSKQAFEFNDFTNFSKTLQNQPHGVMHCAVGTGCTTPDMGFVPIAGLDPVFYMHHANIDRLWQCWLDRKANGQKQDLAWAKKNLSMPDAWYETRYIFADENGNKVEVAIADLFDEKKFPRRYTTDLRCEQPVLKQEAHLVAAAGESPLKSHALLTHPNKVVLRGKPVAVNLQPAAANLKASSLSQTLQKTAGIYLILEDVTIDGAPAVTYDIYIANKQQSDKRIYVATFNLFGAHDHDQSTGERLIFNVTEDVAKLGLTGPDSVSVTFEPTTLSSRPVPQVRSTSGISVGTIRLENTAIRP